jgi:glyoxylase-like metal-dependent hydrolase (beta-lactamase superfamily II)
MLVAVVTLWLAAPASLESYARARAVVDAARAAHGSAALAALGTVEVPFTGQSFARNQSRKPEPPYDAARRDGRLVADLAGSRFAWEQTFFLPGGFDFSSRTVITGREGVRVEPARRRRVPVRGTPAERHPLLVRALPAVQLDRAVARAATLRSLGRLPFDGRPYDVITFAEENGAQLTVFVDPDTHLVRKWDEVVADSVAGDDVSEVLFADYQMFSGVAFPRTRIRKLAGEVVESVTFGTPMTGKGSGGDRFAVGTDLPLIEPGPQSPPLEARPISEGVYLLTGLGGGSYNVLFVDLGGEILVAEAPLDSATARAAIVKIRETLPDKPIKWIAVTHHHDDHAGGVREFVGQGATLVTTPGNARFFQRMMAARPTVAADALKAVPTDAWIETFPRERAFGLGPRRVELRNIGPSPHAEEMVVVWLPGPRLLFQGDLLNAATPGGTDVTANESTVHFADWVARLSPAPLIVTGVHMGLGAPDDLERAVERVRGGTP